MAYVLGLLSPDEKAELERRGWDVEPGPLEMLPFPGGGGWAEDNDFTCHPEDGTLWCQIWVDQTMLQVLDGPDWQDAGLGREARDAINKLRVKLESGQLDETIHELKSREASVINNGGVEEQLRYMVQSGGINYLLEYFEEELK